MPNQFESQVMALRHEFTQALDLKHSENRKSIHDLRNSQQAMQNELFIIRGSMQQLTDMKELLREFVNESKEFRKAIETRVVSLEISRAKMLGATVVLSTLSGAIFAMVKIGIEAWIRHS